MDATARNVDKSVFPAWGPYSKEYAGFSHRPDDTTGRRFDCIAIPATYRGRDFVPNARWDSGYYVTNCAADLTSLKTRHEMSGDGTLFADVSWLAPDDGSVVCEAVFHNRSDVEVPVALHIMCRMAPPRLRPGSDEVRLDVGMPPDLAPYWRPAHAYHDLSFARSRPTDSLVTDGYRRGVEPVQGSVDGVAVAAGWGSDAGDRFDLAVASDDTIAGTDGGGTILRVRYKNRSEVPATVLVRYPAGNRTGEKRLELSPHDAFATVSVVLEPAVPGRGGSSDRFLSFIAEKPTSGLAIDGVFLVPRSALPSILTAGEDDPCTVSLPNDRPALSQPPADDACLELAYADSRYRIVWDGSHDSVIRTVESRHLDELMGRSVHDHVRLHIDDRWAARRSVDPWGPADLSDPAARRGPADPADYAPFYAEVFLRPIRVPGNEARSVRFAACSGTDGGLPEYSVHERAATRYFAFSGSPTDSLPGGGEDVRRGAERLSAVALSNVVYPVEIRGVYRCHTTPGRWWDSVYTWDSGFCGLGLAHVAPKRARECLDTYLGDEVDEHRAFLHHGSPVPVQIYLAKELADLNPGHSYLRGDVHRLLRYYEFLVGRLGSSSTNPFHSGLRTTFDYFYNSGGWDDYPAQAETHRRRIASRVAPVVTNAHLLRFGSLLRGLARLAGCADLTAHIGADQLEILSALRRYSWDDEEGVFGYVVHDDSGNPTGLLRSVTGENFNKGLDGISPILSGMLEKQEVDRLADRLFSDENMWTPWGISTVDTSAGYYRRDGYWNGAVWMPHQWFLWKTCIDLGLGRRAWEIAQTALEMWGREVRESGRCYEHFLVQNGRGAGWHQFGGLSSPVLNWYAAYYVPGTLTVGLDTFVASRTTSDDGRVVGANLVYAGSGSRNLVLLCLADGQYHVFWNGRRVDDVTPRGDACEIVLPPTDGFLEVSRK